jgi:putative phosphoesterase
MGQFEIETNEEITSGLIRIGVISDTHVPDRVGALHPDIIPSFKELNVNIIIHAGDISAPVVIRELEEIAKVHYVQGNRDWWRFKNLPAEKWLYINDVRILISHGHGRLLNYLWEKIPIIFSGYRFERFLRKFSKTTMEFDIVIYGHSHRAENRWVDGKLFFNPGSASDFGYVKHGPSIGLIEILPDKKVKARIIKLGEKIWRRGSWIDR